MLTKSPLLLRDLELMQEIDERTEFSAALSVPTIDEKAWRATEPHTPNPRARLEAVAELTRGRDPDGVLVAPLMPGINDSPEQVERILELAAEAGAAYVTGIALHLRGEVREVFFEWLRGARPDLVARYRELYRRGRVRAGARSAGGSRGCVRGPDLRARASAAASASGAGRPPMRTLRRAGFRTPGRRLFEARSELKPPRRARRSAR